MRTMHLFAGAGGGLLADLILGHTPVCAVEWNSYCCQVLRERVEDGWFPGMHVHEGDVQLFDPSEWQGRVDCIHAGFPCTDISTAGTGAGINGERSGLYREVVRIACVIRPRYVFLENSPAIVVRGLGAVLADMVSLGYDCRWTVLAASDVGAPCERERWWCLASRADAEGQRQQEGIAMPANPSKRLSGLGADEHASLAQGEGLASGRGRETQLAGPSNGRWWRAESSVGRVVNGLANRVQRIKAIGNGQVPLCAAAAWKILGGP